MYRVANAIRGRNLGVVGPNDRLALIARATIGVGGRVVLTMLLPWFLAGCGGAGAAASGASGGGPATTYSISGTVARASNGAPSSGVTISLTGHASAMATADANGRYTFDGLAPGNYIVTPQGGNFDFNPANRAVTISSGNVGNQNFKDVQLVTIASGVDLLPPSFSSDNQLRVSLVAKGDNLYFSDSSDEPLKRLSLSDGSTTPLAPKIGRPESVFLHDREVFWIDGGKLNQTSLDGSQTTVFANGERDPLTSVTPDVLFDSANAYWVNTVASVGCAGNCTTIIQRAALGGGTPVTLASGDRKIVAIASDADNIYWEEDSMEPTSPECHCGSTIKKVPKNGGATVVLVDGTLNGTLPAPGPGYIPGSWLPTGGIAVDATRLYFGVSEISYRIVAVPIAGGSPTTLATVATRDETAGNSIRHITVAASTLYWIDSGNRNLDALPVAGGNVAVLANGLELADLNHPVGLTITADRAYWSEPGTIGGCCLQIATGRIRTVPLNGGVPNTVIDGLDGPVAFALDASDLVFADAWRIARTPVDGGAVATIASGIRTNMARFAIDQSNIYVLDGDFVKAVPIGGGTVEKLAAAHSPNLDDMSVVDQDIATDGSNVYWTAGAMSGPDVVWKASVGGGIPLTLAQGGGRSDPMECYWRIVLDAQNVYFSSAASNNVPGCSVMRVPKNGGATTTLVDTVGLRDFTVDASSLYVSEVVTAKNWIRKIPLSGGAASVLFSANAWVLTNDADNLYWIDPDPVGGGVVAAAKTGTDSPRVLVGPISTDTMLARDAIVVDPSGLYWSEAPDGNVFAIQ